jgi:hypothetical protein
MITLGVFARQLTLFSYLTLVLGRSVAAPAALLPADPAPAALLPADPAAAELPPADPAPVELPPADPVNVPSADASETAAEEAPVPESSLDEGAMEIAAQTGPTSKSTAEACTNVQDFAGLLKCMGAVGSPSKASDLLCALVKNTDNIRRFNNSDASLQPVETKDNRRLIISLNPRRSPGIILAIDLCVNTIELLNFKQSSTMMIPAEISLADKELPSLKEVYESAQGCTACHDSGTDIKVKIPDEKMPLSVQRIEWIIWDAASYLEAEKRKKDKEGYFLNLQTGERIQAWREKEKDFTTNLTTLRASLAKKNKIDVKGCDVAEAIRRLDVMLQGPKCSLSGDAKSDQ